MTKDLILTFLHQGHNGLLKTFNAVPDDKLTWKPLDNGRTALDLFSEAAQTCAMVAEVARSRGETKPSYETFKQMAGERADWDKATALSRFEANFAALIAAVEELTQEELAAPVTMPIGGGMMQPLAGWIMMAYRTLISRFAQINYIQTLYGDFEMH
jgi:hypothetical protein